MEGKKEENIRFIERKVKKVSRGSRFVARILMTQIYLGSHLWKRIIHCFLIYFVSCNE